MPGYKFKTKPYTLNLKFQIVFTGALKKKSGNIKLDYQRVLADDILFFSISNANASGGEND
jgi:hypothetical protein